MVKLIVRNIYKSYITFDHCGLGDFIKGCLYLKSLSNTLNFIPKVNYNNHIIREYLSSEDSSIINDENIKVYISKDKNEFENLLQEKILEQEKTNQQLELNIFTNIFTNDLSDDDFAWFKRNFIPTQLLNDSINLFLKNNNLKKNNFDILHIRCGDIFLNNSLNEMTYSSDKLYDIIHFYILKVYNLHKKYLILSDYNNLGNIINKKYLYNFVVTKFKPIHTGTIDKSTNKQQIFETLMELFLMSQPKTIYNFSIYQWPSNFSYWISKAYNINYKYIQMIDLSNEINNLSIIKLSKISKNNNDNNNNNINDHLKLKTEITNLFINKTTEDSPYKNIYNQNIFYI
jgi:hypothetical protein